MEFAVVAPLLFALVFGMTDFGYAFSRTLDVRHGAREAARLAAVNYTTFAGSTPQTGSAQQSLLVATACARMDGGKGATVTFAGGGDVGTSIQVTVKRPLTSLSGLYNPMLNGKFITSAVKTRTEVKTTWTAGSGTCS